MGPIDSPPIPTAWRERPQSPTGPKQIGLELIGRVNGVGQPAVYWAADYAGCYEAAAADGWKL